MILIVNYLFAFLVVFLYLHDKLLQLNETYAYLGKYYLPKLHNMYTLYAAGTVYMVYADCK